MSVPTSVALTFTALLCLPPEAMASGGPLGTAAVVVGADYPGAGQDLPFTRTDADKISGALASGGYRVLRPKRKYQAGLAETLALATAAKDGLFYFSGHCVMDRSKGFSLRLAPRGKLLSLRRLIKKTRVKIFVLDCCFAARASLQTGRLAGRGGRYLLAAGRARLKAPLNENKMSPFSEALVAALHKGRADANGDGAVSVLEAARFVDTRNFRRQAGQWTAFKRGGASGDPALALVPPGAVCSGRCKRWRSYTAWLRACLAKRPAAVAPPGLTRGWCEGLGGDDRALLERALEARGIGALLAPLLLAAAAPGEQKMVVALKTRLGQKVRMMRLPLEPSGARLETVRWLAALLANVTTVVRLELLPSRGGTLVVRAVEQERGRVLCWERLKAGATAADVYARLRKGLLVVLRGFEVDRVVPASDAPGARLEVVARFEQKVPAAVRVQIRGCAAYTVRVVDDAAHQRSCALRSGHCLRLDVGSKCQTALEQYREVKLRKTP